MAVLRAFAIMACAVVLAGCSASPIEGWPVGQIYVAEELVLGGEEVPDALASTFRIVQYDEGQARLDAFGCTYGGGPIVFDGDRIVEFDLTVGDECIPTDNDLFLELREEIFSVSTFEFEDNRLFIGSDDFSAVLVPE